MPGPLAGFRILDLSSVLMGPYATQTLGDLGAEIVKVEPPEGDIVRRIGPARSAMMGAMFLTVGRSKRSVVLDLKRPSGTQALLRLAGHADVLVTNIRPAAMERLGLGYGTLAEANPGIIYCSLVGYGQGGPYAARPAYDDLIQAATAVPALAACNSGAEPRYAPLTLADRVVGLHAATAILAALLHRGRSGRGQLVEMPMFETMASFVLGDHLGGQVFDPPLDEGGYARLLTPNRRPYETLDGHIAALIYTDAHWHRFFVAVQRPEMLADPRFADHSARSRHIDSIYAEVGRILCTRTTADWKRLFEDADIPCSPVNSLSDLLADPHLLAVGLVQTVDHPTEGAVRSVRAPTIWSETMPDPPLHAPGLGEHGRPVLEEAGCAEAEIEAWAADGGLFLPQETR